MTVLYLSRGAWGELDLPRRGVVVPVEQFRGVVVHHTVVAAPSPPGDVAQIGDYMRRLQMIRPDLGRDVPYSFVAFAGRNDNDAILCEGRGFSRTGAHTTGYNSSRYGVAYAADTRTDPVTPGMEAAVRYVLDKINDPVPTTGHKDHKATECPGPAGVDSLPRVQPAPAHDDEEGPNMETLIDSTTGEGWVTAGDRARPLSDVDAWMGGYDGPVIRSPNMRHVIPDLYELVG